MHKHTHVSVPNCFVSNLSFKQPSHNTATFHKQAKGSHFKLQHAAVIAHTHTHTQAALL